MRRSMCFLLCLLTPFLFGAGSSTQSIYQDRNPELGIVYRPVSWDKQQWDEVFRDPAPPAGWAMIPIGRESCTALTSWWLNGVRNKGMRPAALMDPFLTKQEIEKTIDCAVPLGVRRIVLDEYISYHTKNLNRNLCTVINEARDIYQNAKRKYPGLELGINDNWHIWMVDLSKNQAASKCGGSYPYFQYDQTGVSVLSKYGNPATGQCGRPTAAEMREQLIDLRRTVSDYSRTGKIFAWQLNQHWYPQGLETLMLFREMKKLYGYNRFFLFGPTTNDDFYGNWGYNETANRQGCSPGGYNWYLPARDYLVKLIEGKKAQIDLNHPSVGSTNSVVSIQGKIHSGTQGVAVNNLQLLVTPQADSLQRFERELTSPPNARIALIGIRVNLQQQHKIKGAARFILERVLFSRTGSSNNLVLNSEFDRGLQDWVVLGTGSVKAEASGSENYLHGSSTINQSISVTSIPVFVTPNRSYKLRFDARIFEEARNNGYFFVSWYTTKEVRRDYFHMKFPEPTVVAKTNSGSSGNFNFQWKPSDPGFYSVAGFFPGSSAYQPTFRNSHIQIQ